MRRSLFGLTVSAVAAICLTACSGGSSSSTPSAANAATASSSSSATPQQTYSQSNIDAILKAYTGPDAKFPSTFGTATKGALKIGWSSACNANELVSRLGAALGKEITAMGGTEVSYDANCDANAQVGQVLQLINDKVDAIIVWPLDATALNPSFIRAKAAGIPVLAVEATPDGSAPANVTGQIIYGRDEEAYLAAKLMSEAIPGAEVSVMKFAVPVPSIVYYAQRAAYWAAQDGLKVVGTYDNPSDNVAGGESAAGPMLSAHPGLKGVLAYNDSSANGTFAAARAAGRSLVIFGENGEDAGIDAVKAGQIAYTLQPPIVTWAKELVNGAYLAKAGKHIPVTVFPGVGTVVTDDTAGSAKHLLDLIDSASYGN